MMSLLKKLVKWFKRRSERSFDRKKTYTVFLSNYADLGELIADLKRFPKSMIVEGGVTYEGDVLFLNVPDRRLQGEIGIRNGDEITA